MGEEKLELNKVCVILEVETNTPIEDATDAGIIKEDLIKLIGRENFPKFIKSITCFGYGAKHNLFGEEVKPGEKIYDDRFKTKVLIFRNCKPESSSMFLGEAKDGDESKDREKS